MAITLVQHTGANSSGNVTTRTITYSSAPTLHNLLVACIAYGNAGTLTLPTGWTLGATVVNGSTLTVALAYAADCATTNGLVFTIGTSGSLEVAAAEYSGLATTSPLDVTATNSGASTTEDSGTTATTAQASELWVAALGYVNASAQALGAPTNSFAEEQLNNSTGGTNIVHVTLNDKIASSTGTANTSRTIAASSTWGGVVATFKTSAGAAVTGACTMGGQGAISTATGVLGAVGTSTLSGQGSMTGAGIVALVGASTMGGQGALIVAFSTSGAATLGGQGSMTAAGVVGVRGASTLGGQGNMSAFARQLIQTNTSTITVSGNPVTIEAGSLNVSNAIGQRSTATFVIRDETGLAHYDEGMVVIIKDKSGVTAFYGYVVTSREKKPGRKALLLHTVQSTDAGYLADKRIAAKSYTNQTAGFIVNDLLTTYLAGEGVSAGTIQAGPTIVAATFNYVPVSDCIKLLAEKSGFWWDIDQNKLLQFQASGNVPAPFNVSSSVDMIDKSVAVDRGTPLYRNRQWIRGIHAVTSAQTETRKGDSLTRAFTFSYPLNQVPSACTVNAVSKTLGIQGIDTGKDFYWSKGSPVLSQDTSGTLLIATDVLSLTYIGQFVAIVESDDLAAQTTRAVVEGGTTGIVEDVIDGPEMNSLSEGFESANAKLAKFTVTGQAITFDLLTPGLGPGQTVTVNCPDHGIVNQAMLIESVTISDSDPFLVYTCVALLGPFNTSWVQFFALLAKKVSLIDNLSLGASGTVTTLAATNESWTWTETIAETAFTCPICGPATLCGPGLIVC